MGKWIIGIIALVAVGGSAYFFLGPGQNTGADPNAPGQQQAANVTATPLPPVQASDRVVAEAEVVPVEDVELRFEISGTISEVLVEEGDIVQKGAVIARLDTRDLALQVEERAAALAQTRADYEKLLDGATPDEEDAARARVAIAEARLQASEAAVGQQESRVSQRQADLSRAQAEVARAAGDLQRTRGDVTQSDIAAAQAELNQAVAELADVEDGADLVDIRTAETTVRERQARLEEVRSQLSAAKTRAEAEIELAANALRNVQDEYSSVYWSVRETERNLDDVEQDTWQDQRDREEQALRRVRDAEKEVEKAINAYEEAQQAEIVGIQQAEANLLDAELRLEDVLAGAKEAELAAARAKVASARARLDKLVGEQRAGQLAAAQASVASAQASANSAAASIPDAQADVSRALADVEAAQADLEREQADLENLTAAPRKPDVDDREARILQAEVALKQSERELEKGTLVASMSGEVVETDLAVGERIDPGLVAVRVADFSEWKIETTDLTELGVVRIDIGSPAIVTFDAIPGLEVRGIVEKVQSIGKNEQGDIVYKVTVAPNMDDWDPRLRWGMTATVSIEPND